MKGRDVPEKPGVPLEVPPLQVCATCGGAAEIRRRVLPETFNLFPIGQAIVLHYGTCLTCGAKGPWAETAYAAALLWGTRVDAAPDGDEDYQRHARLVKAILLTPGRQGPDGLLISQQQVIQILAVEFLAGKE